jgi:hypothetical protein
LAAAAASFLNDPGEYVGVLVITAHCRANLA